MISLNTNLLRGSGRNGKWRGGTVLFTLMFLGFFFFLYFLSNVLPTVVSLSACQLPGQHMEPQCTMTNCGYLLVMMEMPGM